jgi:hypothetical protein
MKDTFDDLNTLLEEIEWESEYLQTLEEDEVHSISIENLKSLLKKYYIHKK